MMHMCLKLITSKFYQNVDDALEHFAFINDVVKIHHNVLVIMMPKSGSFPNPSPWSLNCGHCEKKVLPLCFFRTLVAYMVES